MGQIYSPSCKGASRAPASILRGHSFLPDTWKIAKVNVLYVCFGKHAKRVVVGAFYFEMWQVCKVDATQVLSHEIRMFLNQSIAHHH